MKKLKNLCLSLIMASAICCSNFVLANDCVETRYSFDVGSGALKTKANIVDKCKGNIVKNIGEQNKHTKFQKCINASSDGKTMTDECIQKGIKAVKELEDYYNISCKEVKCAGIATAWARKATGGDKLIKSLEDIGVHIKVVSQSEEGRIGFYTAKAHPAAANIADQDMIVFDIGGGSFQLSTLDDEGNVHVYHGPHGVESYDKVVREKFNFRGGAHEWYFSEIKIMDSMKYSRNTIGADIQKDPIISKKLANPNVKVFAIGRPMYLGLHLEMDIPEHASQHDILDATRKFSGKTILQAKKVFPELPDHYIEVAQSSLILIHGIMEGAGIKEFHILGSKATDYVSIDEQYWKF